MVRTPQIQRIWEALRTGRSVCADDLLAWRMPRGSARVFDLRRQGRPIVTEICDQHTHLDSEGKPRRVVQYRLVMSGQPRLFGPG